jgi:hypothetical protein
MERPRRRPEPGFEDNIKMNLNEIVHEGVDLINLDQDKDHSQPLVSTELKLRVTNGEFLDQVTGTSRSTLLLGVDLYQFEVVNCLLSTSQS